MNIALLFVMLYCSYVAFFCEYPWAYKSVILFLGSIIYVALCMQFYFYSERISEKTQRIVTFFMFFGFSVGLLGVGQTVQSARQTDLFYLHYAAIHFLQNGVLGNYDYFTTYPFQQNYTLLLVVIYKIGDLLGLQYRTIGTIFGCLLLFFTTLFIYLIAKKIKDRQLGMLAVFLICTNPVIYLYASYYYTSLLAMLFVSILIYLAIKALEEKNIRLYFIIGVASYLGMQFRSTVGIATIAIIIVVFLKEKKIASKFISIVLGAFSAYFLWALVLLNWGLPLDSDQAFPVTHWLMMGLSGEGKWTGDLWNLTNSVPTKHEKVLLNIEEIRNLFLENSLKDWFALFFKKLSIMWSNGMSGIRGNQNIVTYFGKVYEYTVGNKGFFISYWSQILRCVNLLFLLPVFFNSMKEKQWNNIALFNIFFFGYVLFYCFWEVHESYILTCMPIVYILSAYGMVRVYQWWSEIKGVIVVKYKSNYCFSKHEFYLLSKKIVIFIVMVTLLIAYINAPSLIMDIDNHTEMRVNQPSGGKYSELSSEETVQTFQTKQRFNSVDIKFENDDIVDQRYIFLLENDQGEILVDKEFNSADVENGKYYTFRFSDIFPSGTENYAIVLCSANKYEKNISVYGVSDKKNDYYDFGQLIVNGENIGDMNFKVYCNIKGTLISRKVYFILTLVCLLIELNIYVWIS